MFNGVNIYFLLNLTTINYAGVDLSATGAISLSLPTAITLNSSGNLFLSTLRPNSMSKTKSCYAQIYIYNKFVNSVYRNNFKYHIRFC